MYREASTIDKVAESTTQQAVDAPTGEQGNTDKENNFDEDDNDGNQESAKEPEPVVDRDSSKQIQEVI